MPALNVVARARALVGTRFRPQGRSPAHGIDCIGLAVLAAGIPEALVPRSYRLRSLVPQAALGATFGDRVKPVPPGEAGPGDVVLVRAGAGQHHFLVLTEGGFVHADAGLGRVVETPGVPEWPALAGWRVEERG